MLSQQARSHALGAVVVVLAAFLLQTAVVGQGLVHSGVRIAVFMGGLLVTAAMLFSEGRDKMIPAYVAAFVASFALFAWLAA